MKEITGKRALVTGAASGIGRCTALELAREGVNLFLVDVDGEGLAEVATEADALGVEAHLFTVDVSDWDQVKGLADLIHSRWGPLDILINNAGLAIYRDLAFTPLSEWKRMIGVNLWGPIHFVNAFVPEMIGRRSGHVVNVASWVSFFSFPGSGAYNTTKYAVDGFSNALRYECHRYRVGVTTVFPAVVRTSFYDKIEGNVWTRIGLKVIPFIAYKPETLGRRIVTGIKKGRRRLLIGPIAFMTFYLGGLMDLFLEGLGRVVAGFTCRRER